MIVHICREHENNDQFCLVTVGQMIKARVVTVVMKKDETSIEIIGDLMQEEV